MPAPATLFSGLFAVQRLWMRWTVGYIPTADTRPVPADPHRLGVPDGITLPEPASSGWALDFYRRRVRWRTALGAEMFRFKYRGDTDSGWRLVYAAAAFLRARGIADTIDAIVPVPATPIFREYSPSIWLAERLARLLGKETPAGMFCLTRLGVPQKGITAARLKRKNVAGMYVIAPERRADIAGRRILLIDDICDSGHTLGELRRVLQEAGAREATPFAFARVRLIGQQR